MCEKDNRETFGAATIVRALAGSSVMALKLKTSLCMPAERDRLAGTVVNCIDLVQVYDVLAHSQPARHCAV